MVELSGSHGPALCIGREGDHTCKSWAGEEEIRVGGGGGRMLFVRDFFTGFSISLLLPHLKQEEKSW